MIARLVFLTILTILLPQLRALPARASVCANLLETGDLARLKSMEQFSAAPGFLIARKGEERAIFVAMPLLPGEPRRLVGFSRDYKNRLLAEFADGPGRVLIASPNSTEHVDRAHGRKPARSILLENGFEQSAIDSNLYFGRFDRTPVAALISGANKVQFFIERNGRIASLIRPEAELEPAAANDWYGHKVPHVLVRYRDFEFGISSWGTITPATVKFHKPLEALPLPISKAAPAVPEASGFIVGGVNPTSRILGLNVLDGRSIAELEALMRPGSGFNSSYAGFLDKNESLLSVLARDNETVLDKLRLTHRKIAEPLRVLTELARLGLLPQSEFLWNGRRFRARYMQTPGVQGSPLGRAVENTDIQVENLDTGAKMSFSALMPLLIGDYGFYEGTVRYRLSPEKILEVFDFIKP